MSILSNPSLVKKPDNQNSWLTWIKNLSIVVDKMISTLIGTNSTGGLIITTGNFLLLVKNLTLTGSQQIILKGTSRLRIT